MSLCSYQTSSKYIPPFCVTLQGSPAGRGEAATAHGGRAGHRGRSGAYIIRLLEPDTDLEYLKRVAEEIEKRGVEVEMLYGDIEFSDGEMLISEKSKLPWKQFERVHGDESN